jgi:hypothetical protein
VAGAIRPRRLPLLFASGTDQKVVVKLFQPEPIWRPSP